jgi:hypothetical protein
MAAIFSGAAVGESLPRQIANYSVHHLQVRYQCFSLTLHQILTNFRKIDAGKSINEMKTK